MTLCGTRVSTKHPTSTEVCRVCGRSAERVFTLQVLGRPTGYFDCGACGYLQTETPYWLEQAYQQAINEVDTGILSRNRLNVGRVVMTLCAIRRLKNGRVIDHAGGYGILVRMLRDAGVDARWRDKYCQNLLARGFEAVDDVCDLLTAFEVLEHMVDPVAEISRLLESAPWLLVSTELVPTLSTPPADWWYLVPEQGQHIGFYRLRTLQWIAERLDCQVATDGGSAHIFSRRKIPPAWSFLQRHKRFWPSIVRLALTPKIMSDFRHLSARYAVADKPKP